MPRCAACWRGATTAGSGSGWHPTPSRRRRRRWSAQFGRMSLRTYENYNATNFSTWNQVVELSKNAKAAKQAEVRRAVLDAAGGQQGAGDPAVAGQGGAAARRGRRGSPCVATSPPSWSMVSWPCRSARATGTADVWLDAGTHDLTIFAAAGAATAGARGRLVPGRHQQPGDRLQSVQGTRFRPEAGCRQAGQGTQGSQGHGQGHRLGVPLRAGRCPLRPPGHPGISRRSRGHQPRRDQRQRQGQGPYPHRNRPAVAGHQRHPGNCRRRRRHRVLRR